MNDRHRTAIVTGGSSGITLGVAEVASSVVWLDSLPPNVVLPEVELSSVDSGPFAPEAFVPERARQLGRTDL